MERRWNWNGMTWNWGCWAWSKKLRSRLLESSPENQFWRQKCNGGCRGSHGSHTGSEDERWDGIWLAAEICVGENRRSDPRRDGLRGCLYAKWAKFIAALSFRFQLFDFRELKFMQIYSLFFRLIVEYRLFGKKINVF